MNSTIDYGRRDFFTKIALASASCYIPLSLVSCGEDKINFVGTGQPPFKVWEEMLQAVMTSPDYLPGEMERLIATKDARLMYEFVKDAIQLIPTRKTSLSGMGNESKWGFDGVLRCGMATPREKAELLQFMFENAGITSKIVYEKTKITPEDVPSFFLRPIERTFEPQISKSQLKSWKKEMGISSVEIPDNLQKDYRDSAKNLSEKILPHLNIEERSLKNFDYRWDNYRTPTVEFEENGTKKYAHLFDPATEFGSLRNPDNKVGKAAPIKENSQDIRITISCRKSLSPKKEIEIVSGVWKAKDLVGKQIWLQFLHGLTVEEQLVTTINQLRTFTPTLSLQGMSTDKEFLESNSFLGDTFTLEGDKIKLDPKDGVPAHVDQFLPKSKPDLQKKVESIALAVSASNFPTVKASIDARDASGALVEGLSPKDFVLTENGVPVKAIMEHNQRTPRILVLSDYSGSMPDTYRKKGMAAFNQRLKDGILEDFPAAQITFWGTPSALFTWLLKASRTNFDLIVYATDGDNDDRYNEKNLSVYQAGPPAIVLNVKNTSYKGRLDTFTKMAEITNGIVFNAEDQELALNEITAYVKKLDPAPYSFTYGSSDKEKLHTLKVMIDNKRVQETTTYQFPQDGNGDVNTIIGLYFTVKVGRGRAVQRVLAGYDPVYRFDNLKNQLHGNSIKQLLLGGALLSVEGEGPTRAMALHDFLKAKLSHRTWGEKYMQGDSLEAKELHQKGVKVFPGALISLMEPLQDTSTKNSLTYPSGYRMGLLKTEVGINGGVSMFSFDYLPTSNYYTLATSPLEAFQTTLLKTAQLAEREATQFTQSTMSYLKDANLFLHGKTSRDWLKSVEINYKDKDYPYWNEKLIRGGSYYKLSDSKALSKAFWQIHKTTGELYGMMPDGSGGGKSPSDDTINGVTNIINLLMAITAVTAHIATMFGGAILSPTGGLA